MSLTQLITSVLLLSSCQGFRSSNSGSFRGSRRFSSSGGFGSFSSGGFGSFGSNGFGGSFRKSFGGGTSLAQVLATRPSNADPSVDVAKESLVPNKLPVAPPQTAKIYWSSSGTSVSPGEAIDAIKMTDRPTMRWTYDPSALYTILCIDEGIPALQPPNLQFIHWMVSNVPGDRVYAGDENYEYIPPFSFKLDSNNQLVEDGSPLHAILFLVYKQSGRVDITEGQNGCNPELGARAGNKDAIAAKYNLGEPVAGNVIFTKYSPAGTDYLFCKFTRCKANPLGDGPFPLPLPGINDQPQCQP